jgi:hypothetical protein
MIPFQQCIDWEDDSDSVFQGFFGRGGGVSTGIYESLNCGPGTDDDPGNVAENRRRVAEAAGVKPENLLSLYQVHGNKCLVIDEPFSLDNRPQADAMVTDKKGIALSILTADCTPVLLQGKSPGGPVIGAAHAGWGGALKGVLEATVGEMEKLGAGRKSITASIGPCIDAGSYEVQDEFAEPFIAQDESNRDFFIPGRKGHLQFDLSACCIKRLADAGVGKIFLTGIDTYKNEREYFSYRRSVHNNDPDYGRQISVIAIRS